MRTTLHIDDDVFKAASGLAEAEGKTLDQVVSELARRGLPQKAGGTAQHVSDHGFPMFAVAAEATPITFEMVQRALEDG